ncbi:UNVERIFIED_CONTAM: hypothetical protein FKN15_061516 [Acipenser sinensis]
MEAHLLFLNITQNQKWLHSESKLRGLDYKKQTEPNQRRGRTRAETQAEPNRERRAKPKDGK